MLDEDVAQRNSERHFTLENIFGKISTIQCSFDENQFRFVTGRNLLLQSYVVAQDFVYLQWKFFRAFLFFFWYSSSFVIFQSQWTVDLSQLYDREI